METDELIIYPDTGKIFSKKGQRFLNSPHITLKDGKTYKTHNIAYEIYNGKIPDNMFVNHIDRNKKNNSINNLELMTHPQIHQNQKKTRYNTSGLKGIYYVKNKDCYKVSVCHHKTRAYLGHFGTIEEANNAYIDYILKMNEQGCKERITWTFRKPTLSLPQPRQQLFQTLPIPPFSRSFQNPTEI